MAILQREPKYSLLTYDEYLEIAEEQYGNARTELVHGKVIELPPPKPWHRNVANKLHFVLNSLLHSIHAVMFEASMKSAPLEGPLADIVVCASPQASYADDYVLVPSDILIVVEVMDTTRHKDLGRNLATYAASAIPEYWVVNRLRNRVEVRTKPVEGAYTEVAFYRPGEVVNVSITPDAQIDVAAFLNWEDVVTP